MGKLGEFSNNLTDHSHYIEEDAILTASNNRNVENVFRHKKAPFRMEQKGTLVADLWISTTTKKTERSKFPHPISQHTRFNPPPNNNITMSQPTLFYPPRGNDVNSQPSLFYFPKAIPQINTMPSQPPLYYPQMNMAKSQPLLYFPKSFPQTKINKATTQKFPPVVNSRVNPQHFPIPEEQSRSNNEMVFPSNQQFPNNEQMFYHPHPPNQQLPNNKEIFFHPLPFNQQFPNNNIHPLPSKQIPNNKEMSFHPLPPNQKLPDNKVMVQQFHHSKDSLLIEIEDEIIKPNEQIEDDIFEQYEQIEDEPIEQYEQIEDESIERYELIDDEEQLEFGTIYPEELTERIPNTETENQRRMIYIIPDMQIESAYAPDLKFPTSELWFDYLNSTGLPRVHENNHCIAIDCEMVGVGEGGRTSALARVSIVNYYGEILLDKFVRITRRITDYRTPFSGITPQSLTDAIEFNQVQKEVEKLMGGHVVVGQSVYFDFKALKTKHPDYLVRDTSFYNSIFGLDRETLSLKKLAKNVLGINIQEGEHDSIEDARASMIIYRHRQAEWEEYLKKNGYPKPRGCRICNAHHVVNECPYNRKNYKKRRDFRGRNRRDDNIDYDEYNRDPNTSKYYSYSGLLLINNEKHFLNKTI
ncbi:7470_t:CDS:2 [Funneliformis geosporum]|nr:7470_t:CDS:2 [Funneliformis geosporum]